MCSLALWLALAVGMFEPARATATGQEHRAIALEETDEGTPAAAPVPQQFQRSAPDEPGAGVRGALAQAMHPGELTDSGLAATGAGAASTEAVSEAASGETGPPPLAPGSLVITDTPSDDGSSLDLVWEPSPSERIAPERVIGYAVERAVLPGGPFVKITEQPPGTTRFTDSGLSPDTLYHYQVRTVGPGARLSEPGQSAGSAQPLGQWLDRRKIPTLLLTVLFSVTVVLLVRAARQGKEFYVRPIPGLSAVDEAIGRSTEMGRPILFVTGLGVSSEVATLAAFTLLGRVARRTAEYQTRVLVPCYDPMNMAICQEIVKASCLDAGRPDMYQEKDIYFVTQDQFSYTAAVNGVILRERPATNFYIGKFYAESLVLAETGNLAGSIQIAGTDEMTQIPFFVAACDYTLIGEELYASSAYLSREPPLLGTLKAQDYGKAAIVGILLIGTALALLAQSWFANFFRVE